jgi:hypothetical protein
MVDVRAIVLRHEVGVMLRKRFLRREIESLATLESEVADPLVTDCRESLDRRRDEVVMSDDHVHVYDRFRSEVDDGG